MNFYRTCEISHLPIMAGDEVVIIPLLTHKEKSHTHGYQADDAYTPFALPIIAKYDGCDGLENIVLSEANKSIFRLYTFFYNPHPDTLNINDPISYDDFKSDSQFVNEIICSEDMYEARSEILPNIPLEPKKINFFMCHRILYESLLDDMKKRVPHHEEMFAGKGTIESFWRKDKAFFMDKAFEQSGKLSKYRETHEFVPKLANLLDDMAEELFGCYCIHNKACVKPMCAAVLKNPDLKDEFLQGAIDIHFTALMMNYMRIGYEISSGLGSQCEETRLHVIMAEFILKKVKEKNKKSQEHKYMNPVKGIRADVYY